MRREQEPEIDEVNFCDSKRLSQWIRSSAVTGVYLAFIRQVEEEPETVVQTEIEVEKMFHDGMPNVIKAVLNEFSDIFCILKPYRRWHQCITADVDSPSIDLTVYQVGTEYMQVSPEKFAITIHW